MSRREIAVCVPLFAAILLAAPGCSRVSFEKSLTLEPVMIRSYNIDAPRGEQKIRVEIESKEPIDVDVAFASDVPLLEKYLERGRNNSANKAEGAPPVLAFKLGATQNSIEATIPAGRSYTILLSGAKKKTDVKLKVNSI